MGANKIVSFFPEPAGVRAAGNGTKISESGCAVCCGAGILAVLCFGPLLRAVLRRRDFSKICFTNRRSGDLWGSLCRRGRLFGLFCCLWRCALLRVAAFVFAVAPIFSAFRDVFGLSGFIQGGCRFFCGRSPVSGCLRPGLFSEAGAVCLVAGFSRSSVRISHFGRGENRVVRARFFAPFQLKGGKGVLRNKFSAC